MKRFLPIATLAIAFTLTGCAGHRYIVPADRTIPAPATLTAHVLHAVEDYGKDRITVCYFGIIPVDSSGAAVYDRGPTVDVVPGRHGDIRVQVAPGRYRVVLYAAGAPDGTVWKKNVALAVGAKLDLGTIDASPPRRAGR
jgi:hypothetical protein